MQADNFYILAVSFYCLILGFIVPRLFKLKFLPIGYMALGGASAILGFVLNGWIYGLNNIWEYPVRGMFWATVVCFTMTAGIFFIRKKPGKSITENIPSRQEKFDIQEVKSLIAENEIEEACEKLIKLTSSNRKRNDELILIKGKIHKIKSENRIGVLTNEERDIGYSRISYSLLEIANSL